MKTLLKLSLLFILACPFFQSNLSAQNVDSIFAENQAKLVLVEKQDGAKFIGEILKQDEREILLKTVDLGNIYIPKHMIKSISEISLNSKNEYHSDELFATRYFITTNGLPIKKGENYIQWNLYGPDFQFGVADNFGVGIMTSWLAVPVIANAKYSLDFGKNKSMALGLLAGTGSYALPDYGLLLPFVSFTVGDRRNNITFTTGYGALFLAEENYNYYTDSYDKNKRVEKRILLSLAGMVKINDKISLVFDTFIAPKGSDYTGTRMVDYGFWDENTQQYVPNYKEEAYTEESPGFALILPGLRFALNANSAFQFGFTGLYLDDSFVQVPIPTLQLYRKL